MSRWKLSLLLLLTLTISTETKEERHLLVRGGGSEEVIPVCLAETPVVMVVCRIRTDKEQGDECRLFYQHNRGFESDCRSRFTLTLAQNQTQNQMQNQTQNQTAFLHLSSLTPEDSGDYTCVCSLAEGMRSLYLNITVIDDGTVEGVYAPAPHGFWYVLIGVTAVVTAAAAFLGLIVWIRKRNRGKSESAIPGSPVHKAPGSLDPREAYSNLRRPVCQIYQNISKSVTAKPHHQDGDMYMRCMIYENV